MDYASIKIIRAATRAFKKPADFKMVTVAANDGAVWLCVYENEIMGFESSVRQDIFTYMNNVKLKLEQDGLKAYLVGRPGDPPAAQ